MLLIKDIIDILEAWAPPALAESYDNSCLIVGNKNSAVNHIVINLDLTQEVIAFAKHLNANLIICHHPIWFGSKQNLVSGTWVNDLLIDAIKSDIALYAFHTNFDNIRTGVNKSIAALMGLQRTQILLPKPKQLQILYVNVPTTHQQAVQEALFAAGAGKIGDYDNCSFFFSGTGTFRPLSGSNPFLGEKDVIEITIEDKLEVVFPAARQVEIIRAMKQAHPYEEVAFQIITTENYHSDIGAGIIGYLPEPVPTEIFLGSLKAIFSAEGIRYADTHKTHIEKVAICGGSGSFLISESLKQKADALVTADITYHKFFEPDKKMLLVDIGHYESEQFAVQQIHAYIQEKFSNFAASIFTHSTNPIRYFR